jgi:hypothetical protein
VTTQREYADALGSLPRGTFDSRTWQLLEAVEAAWRQAEGGIPTENEARRWSPVCDAALRLAGGDS